MKIEMKDPKGVTLLTAGKKLDENIEVVPSFATAETVNITIVDGVLDNTITFTAVIDGLVKTISTNDGASSYKVVKNSLLYGDGSGGVGIECIKKDGTRLVPIFSEYGDNLAGRTVYNLTESVTIYTYV